MDVQCKYAAYEALTSNRTRIWILALTLFILALTLLILALTLLTLALTLLTLALTLFSLALTLSEYTEQACAPPTEL